MNCYSSSACLAESKCLVCWELWRGRRSWRQRWACSVFIWNIATNWKKRRRKALEEYRERNYRPGIQAVLEYPPVEERARMNEPQKKIAKPVALEPEKLRWRCEPARLPFETTAQAELREGFVGQERALRALKMGVELTRSEEHTSE